MPASASRLAQECRKSWDVRGAIFRVLHVFFIATPGDECPRGFSGLDGEGNSHASRSNPVNCSMCLFISASRPGGIGSVLTDVAVFGVACKSKYSPAPVTALVMFNSPFSKSKDDRLSPRSSPALSPSRPPNSTHKRRSRGSISSASSPSSRRVSGAASCRCDLVARCFLPDFLSR